jgi:hypothetical protein
MRAEVEDPVDRVNPQAIDVIFGEPIERVVDDETPDAVTQSSIVVDGASPGRVVVVRVIRAELGQIVAFWADVIVDHVEHHG